MKRNDDISEDEDSKPNIDKDDEDYSDSNPKSPSKNPKSSSKKPNKVSDYLNLLRKHKRSDNSSNSSNSSLCEDNNNKKNIKELSSLQKTYVENQKENFEKNYNILKEDFKVLEEYEMKIFKDANLDIMFIMDLTGSMGIWLNETKKSVKKIIEEITDNNPGSKIRISFIGYRDFRDKNEKRKYDSHEFTENIGEFNNFLMTLDCNGGGDEPEDVVGALRQALKMDWASNSKYAVLVCDAPCHGKKYHNISYDEFPDGDPDGVSLEDVIQQFYQKDITLYCIEINNSTKKMFNVMRNIYKDNDKFHVENLGNSVHQFSFFVEFSASIILGNAKYNKVKFMDVLANCRKETIEKIMKKYLKNNKNCNIINNEDSITSLLIKEIDNLNIGKEDKILFDFIDRMNNLNINNDNNANINNEDYIFINLSVEDLKKFEKKEINCILRALSYNKNNNIVNDWLYPTIQEKNVQTQLLISFNTLKKDDNNKEYEINFLDKILNKEKKGIISFKISKKLYNNPNEYIKEISYDELICEQIADYFNILMDKELPFLKQFIKFQKHILYEIDDKNPLNEEQLYLQSKYIISEDSNSIQLATAVPSTKRILQCFSHFSYQITGGQILIADINYDKGLKKVIEFKKYSLNNEYNKILEFFSLHICDNTCKTLGLTHPRKKLNTIEIKETFYSNKYLINTNLCKCCSVPFHNFKNNKDNKNLNCGFCSLKEARSKIKTVCSSCHCPFEYSIYAYNSQLISHPNKCEKCNSLL